MRECQSEAQDAKALEVQQWLSKAGSPETSSQLRGMVATLEQEAETNRLKLKNRQSLLDALEKANVEKRQALLLQEASTELVMWPSFSTVMLEIGIVLSPQ